MTGSAKQSIVKAAGKRVDCFAAALLAMTATPNTTSRSRGAMGPSLAKTVSPLLTIEGAGNAGCPMHPQPRVRNETKHTSVVTTGTPDSTRHSPRNGFTAYFVLSPARSGLFVTVISRLLGADLTPASRRQNHTTSPSASAPFVTCAARVHRIPPRVRDVRNAPLLGQDVIDIEVIWVRREGKYFCKRGWTTISENTK
jgi:hypothetical protein